MSRGRRAAWALGAGACLLWLLARGGVPPSPAPVPRPVQVGDRHWRVPSRLRDAYFADPGRVNREIGLVPRRSQDGGTLAELRIGRLDPDGPAHHAGLRVGDRVLEVGGRPVATMERALGLSEEFRRAGSVTLRIERGSIAMDFRFDFE
jgi:membrane-associated protease RseP (regulator of RpoE activity)